MGPTGTRNQEQLLARASGNLLDWSSVELANEFSRISELLGFSHCEVLLLEAGS
jgi:hypothetical protein